MVKMYFICSRQKAQALYAKLLLMSQCFFSANDSYNNHIVVLIAFSHDSQLILEKYSGSVIKKIIITRIQSVQRRPPNYLLFELY